MDIPIILRYCILCVFIIRFSHSKDCFHDEYKEETEIITSAGFPLGYLPNSCSEWFITAPKGQIITLSIFLDIEVGDDGSCNRDALTIGPEPVMELCGNNRQLVYISNSSHVWLKFYTDGLISGKGFKIQYIRGPPVGNCKTDQFLCNSGRCVLKKWLCNGLDECGDGSDENAKTCPSATDIPTSPSNINCGEGFFHCYSNLSSAFICLPEAKRCDGSEDCYRGLDEQNCSINCNAHIHSEDGYITSPLYPRDYPPGMNCKWTIHMQIPSDRIQLRVVDFAVQANADSDYLIVYDGKEEESDQILGTFYGNHIPPSKLESKSNWMTIVFHSDDSFSEKGFNFTYQRKGLCLSNQVSCGNGEIDCFDAKDKCNGVWDCQEHGGDEIHCGNCNTLYTCGPGSSQCYPRSHRCNGVGFCSNKMDEKNCSPSSCGTHNGTFLCQNKNCVYEAWICDKTDDCGDWSDEVDCSRATNLIIIAAVSGSLICGLLLVVALGCTCKLYNLRQQQLHGPRHETPLSRVYAEFMRRRAPPPYHEAMLTSRPYEEARREYMERLGQTEERSRSSGRRPRLNRRGRSNRNRHSQDQSSDPTQNTNSENNSEESANTSVTAISQENTVNSTHSNIQRHSSRSALLPSDSGDSDTESELGTPSADSVRVHFSEETGISAEFHRRSSPGKEVTEGENSSNIPRSSPSTGPDVSSLDNATIASCDSVDPSQEEDKNKPKDISSALTLLEENPPSNSNRALFIPENGQNQGNVDRGRHDSAGSLNSTGSDNPWGDFTGSEAI